jgi:hypothetical protein
MYGKVLLPLSNSIVLCCFLVLDALLSFYLLFR